AHLHDLRAGGTRQHVRRIRRRLHHEPDHLRGRRAHLDGDGLRHRLRHLHRADVRPSRRHLRQAHMSWGRLLGGLFGAFLGGEPFLPLGRMREYFVHVLVQIFIWSFIGGAWSLMGRFRLTSLRHRALLGGGGLRPCPPWATAPSWGSAPTRPASSGTSSASRRGSAVSWRWPSQWLSRWSSATRA